MIPWQNVGNRWTLQMCLTFMWLCYMIAYFKSRRIMHFTPLVVVRVVRLGNDRAHFETRILGNRSEHVTAAQKSTRKSTKHNSANHTSRFRWVRPRGSVVQMRSVVPLFRWIRLFLWLPFFRWVPLAAWFGSIAKYNLDNNKNQEKQKKPNM